MRSILPCSLPPVLIALLDLLPFPIYIHTPYSLRPQQLSHPALRHHHSGSAVPHHVFQPLFRVPAIQSQIGSPSLPSSQQSDHHFRASLQINPYSRLMSYSELFQISSETAHSTLQFCIGELCFAR